MSLRTDQIAPLHFKIAAADNEQELGRTLWAIFAGAMIIGLSVWAHLLHPALAVLIAFSLTAVLTNWMPSAALVAIFFATIFQNLMVSIISPGLTGESDLNIARGYSFVMLCSVWGIAFLGYFIRLRGQIPALDRVMNKTNVVFLFILLYFLLGAAQNPLNAVINLRGIASALMFFQISLIFFSHLNIRLTAAFAIISGLLILFGYVELFFRDEWLDWTNGHEFWDISIKKARVAGEWDKDAFERGIVVKGFIDTITVDLFNTPLLKDLKIQVTRMLGPNMHPISYAYAIAFFLMFALFRGAFITAFLLLPLLLFANAKGAIILLLLAIFSWCIAKTFGSKIAFWSLIAGLLVYIAAGIFIGLKIGDFHVLGFMGGVHNFLGNPLGHGIGVGGNLSTDFNTLDWPAYQAAGRTPIAIESAVGVMLFQMGIATFIYLGVCIWIAWKSTMIGALTGQSIHLAAGFSLLTVLVNGIFQEEALFSPLAFAFIMGLNGMILGAAIRADVLD